MPKLNTHPTWSPRLPQSKIRRLYENDAQGIYDIELIDEVGFRLLARCQSFIDAVEAAQGMAACPHCGKKIPHNHDKAFLLECTACDWSLTWGEYFSTFQHKQLSGTQPVLDLFNRYIRAFSAASTAREKVFQIDTLIHGFHYYFKDKSPTRPVAVNLIGGRLNEVIAFLDDIHTGKYTTPGTAEHIEEWDRNIQNAKKWGLPVNRPLK